MRKAQMRERRRNLQLPANSGSSRFGQVSEALVFPRPLFCWAGQLIAIASGVFHLLGCHPRSLSFTDTFAARVARFFPVHLSPYLGHSRRRFFPSQQQSTTHDGQECPLCKRETEFVLLLYRLQVRVIQLATRPQESPCDQV